MPAGAAGGVVGVVAEAEDERAAAEQRGGGEGGDGAQAREVQANEHSLTRRAQGKVGMKSIGFELVSSPWMGSPSVIQ